MVCGFYAILPAEKSSDTILYQRSIDALTGRGPDSQQYVLGSWYFLGATRLQIEGGDSSGQQPMNSLSGNSALVYNGEIYNYKELSRLYFSTQEFRSDSEFLIEFLERFGSSKLKELNGMFAFVFLNLREKKVLAVRDRLGVKPLYYRTDGAKIEFASNLKAIISQTKNLELNLEAIEVIKIFRSTPFGQTIYSKIQELPGGTLMEASCNQTIRIEKIEPWWNLRDYYDEHAVDKDELFSKFELACKLREHRVLPAGLFASGGIDSFLVGTTLTHELATIYVDSVKDSDFDSKNSKYLFDIAKMQIRKVHPPSSGWRPMLERVVRKNLNIVSVENALVLSEMSKVLKQKGLKIALTGDGADELFFGYEELSFMLISGEIDYDDFFSLYNYGKTVRRKRDEIRAIANDAFGMTKEDYNSPGVFLKWFWIKVHLRTLLTRLDESTAENSIEARSPFLDFNLVEYAASLRPQTLMNGKLGKWPLRELAYERGHKKALINKKNTFKVSHGKSFENYSEFIDFQKMLILKELSK
jgi:asparagine synthase (glutamine-hydrolysing)